MKAEIKITLWLAGILLFITTAVAAWFMQPMLLLIPPTAIILFYFFQYPVILFYALLFSIPWSIEFHFSSSLGTDLPDEPLMLLSSLATIILLITRRQFISRKNIHPLVFILLVQFVWLILSVVTSTYTLLSVKYLLAKTWYLLAFFVLPFFLWKDEKIFKRSAALLCISMLVVTAVSMIRHASLGFTFSTVNEALSPFFRNHVNYSALLVFILPLQVLFWQQAKTKNIRLLVTLSFFITLPALYFSFARGAWLAAIAGMITYFLLERNWLLQTFFVSVIFIVASVFWLRQNDRYLQFAHDYKSTIFHQQFDEHLAATYQLKDMSTAERFYRWIAGVRMMEDSWPTGFGPTTFYQHYKSYTVPAFKTWVSDNKDQSTVHNYFLLLAIEQGIAGLLLFLFLLGMAFWYAQTIYHRTNDIFWKRIIAAIAVILVMQCVVNFLSDLIETDKVGSVFYLCIAALVIADKKTKQQENNNQRRMIDQSDPTPEF